MAVSTAPTTPMIDVQVHTYERDHPGRPWSRTLHGPPEVTGNDMIAAMDAVGVDGALLVSPWTMYRFDPSYAIEVAAAHPGRFACITPIDTRLDNIEDVIAEWADEPSAVGVRLMMWGKIDIAADDPGANRALAEAGRLGLPVCALKPGGIGLIGELAARNPDTSVVVDHLGILQPFEPPVPDEPWIELPNLLRLAELDNVSVKVSGACTLSKERFPFNDIWEPIRRVIDAFGIERCMWGTDWTRATSLVTYAEATEAFRHTDTLTEHEKSMLMGGTLQQVFGWTPTAP